MAARCPSATLVAAVATTLSLRAAISTMLFLLPLSNNPRGYFKTCSLESLLDLGRNTYICSQLHILRQVKPGKGKLILTGKLGDVMKESAQVEIGRAHV